ncbi:hypothetical protein E2C01_020691 [Portunus trituberculatus]|uniref:Uncharacterized protein n=1 Tax=Portunus trituberculatus TaxID=210409 RepID=A0A5B7E293_PORTR|nr:hypothetical protein [Portunus trituberculatus]
MGGGPGTPCCTQNKHVLAIGRPVTRRGRASCPAARPLVTAAMPTPSAARPSKVPAGRGEEEEEDDDDDDG